MNKKLPAKKTDSDCHSRLTAVVVACVTALQPAHVLGPMLVGLAASTSGAHAASYTDCKQYGGSRICKDPEKTPWRVGADTLYFTNVPPVDAAAYCVNIKAERVAAATPDMAIVQYANLYTQQVVSDCWLDVSSITQQALCGPMAEGIAVFNTTVQNRQGHPYWNRSVITIPTCDVRLWSINYPGTYYQAPLPWRDACGAGSEPVQAPSGRILCLPEKPKKEDKDRPDCQDAAGNPIDLSNGNKFEAASDYSDAKGDLTFKRYYNSNIDSVGMLGRAWSSEYDARVYYNESAVQFGGTAVALARRGTGAQVTMSSIGTDLFAPDSRDLRQRLKILRNGQAAIVGFVLYDRDVAEQYDSQGRLVKIVRADGYTRTLARDFDERVLSVTDSYGRRLDFGYVDSVSQKGYYVDSLTTPRGQRFQFAYSQVGPDARLTSVLKPDGKVAQYVYEASHRLIGKIDELGIRFSTFDYNVDGDATGTRRAGDVDTVQSVRTTAADGSISLDINDKGVQTTRQYVDVEGRKVMVSQSNPAGSGCAAATRSIAYDTNLNVARIDEFGGARVCRVFDQQRNLKLVEVAGLTSASDCQAVLTPGAPLTGTAAKTSYEWHPDFERPTRVASPKNLATFVFNGQADPSNGGQVASCAPPEATLPDGKPVAVLCKAIEQATLDASGAAGFSAVLDAGVPARVTRFTYNATGQVLTQTDPRGFATNFSYYTTTGATATAGDLQSITPPRGLSTTFASYNPDGFSLAFTDSNGLATTFEYDVLNRTTRSVVGSLTTTFTYDDKGRLSRVDGAAGERATYGYDGADRLTSISDRAGNSITLSLDVAGNVVREEYVDPNGALKRWLERGFDGLNRMSRIKGVFIPTP